MQKTRSTQGADGSGRKRYTAKTAVGSSVTVTDSVAGIQKNRCRTTVAERMVETLAELPFIGGVRLDRQPADDDKTWYFRTW